MKALIMRAVYDMVPIRGLLHGQPQIHVNFILAHNT